MIVLSPPHPHVGRYSLLELLQKVMNALQSTQAQVELFIAFQILVGLFNIAYSDITFLDSAECNSTNHAEVLQND